MSYFEKALEAAKEKATLLAKEKEGVCDLNGANTSGSNNRLNMIAYCDSKRR